MTPPIRAGSLSAALANLRWLLGSRGLAAVLSLIYLAIVTRSLGAAGFGQFALVTGIAATAVAIVSFQTWQIIVRYGTQHLHDGSPHRLARLIKAALALDFAGAVGGSLLAGLAIVALGPRFGWDDATQRQAMLFCLVVLIAVRSTPIGILRLYDRYGDAAAGDSALPVVRLLGSLAVLAAGPSVTAFLIAWAASEIASSILYWILALRAARALPWRDSALSLAELRAENPGLYSFSLATNGAETLSVATRQLPVLLVGFFATPAAAGAYRLAHQLGRTLARVGQLFARALLPELMRMHTTGATADFASLLGRVVRSAAIGGAVIMLALLLVGRQALAFVVGPEFDAAYPLLLILNLAAIIEVIGVAFQPALMASGRAGLSFRLQLIGALVLIGLMVVLIPAMGTVGAAIAVVAGSLVSVVLMAMAVRNLLQKSALDPQPTDPLPPAADD